MIQSGIGVIYCYWYVYAIYDCIFYICSFLFVCLLVFVNKMLFIIQALHYSKTPSTFSKLN
jgi:hypothetical protein